MSCLLCLQTSPNPTYGRLRPPTARCDAALSRAPALQIARPHQTSPPSAPLARNLEALAETLGATLVSAIGASLGPRLCRPGAQPCLLPSSAAESTTSAPSPEKKTRKSQKVWVFRNRICKISTGCQWYHLEAMFWKGFLMHLEVNSSEVKRLFV